MKVWNEKTLEQIAYNDLSDIDFKYIAFVNPHIKCAANPYYFSVIDSTLASENSLRFRKNLLERIQEQKESWANLKQK